MPAAPPLSPLLPLRLPDHCRVVDWAVGDAPLSDNQAAGLAGRRLVAVIGNLDGVHLGHQALIAECLAACQKSSGEVVPAAITFTPHPRRFFMPDAPGFAIIDDYDKQAVLASLGIEVIVNLVFDEAMRNTSGDAFISSILPSLSVAHLVAGSDFVFGNQRAGNMQTLAALGAAQGISSTAVPLSQSEDGSPISSSRIRQALAKGDMAAAARHMGRPFCLSGEVVKGQQRGRELGFATANIGLGDYQAPAFGVYATKLGLPDSPATATLAGIANIGVRPTVDGSQAIAEVHAFDETLDLYGKRINIFCLDFIRPEKKFTDVAALKQQIDKDIKHVRHWHRI